MSTVLSSTQIVLFTVLLMSLLYLFIIMIIFALKEKVDSIDTKIYKRIMIINFISIILEMTLYVLGLKMGDQHGLLYNVFLIMSKVFTCFICLWFFGMYKYTRVLYYKYTEDKSSNKNKMIDIIVVLCACLLILVLPTTFTIENNVGYTSGPSTKVAGLIMIVESVMMIFYLLKSRKVLKNKEFIPIILSVIFLFLTIAIQMYNPSLLLFNPSITLVTIIMYHTIENPDMKMAKQLELAKEQSEKANRAKTDFLSSMSHEIRTPLNAIVGFSDCIMDAKDIGEAKENARDIVNASQTLLEIVNGILDISKIEAGKIEIVNSKYKGREAFIELAKLITPKMHEKGLDFTYSIAEDVPDTLYGDHANIKKIVTNLLSNACKYTDKGFVHYEVNCVNSANVSKLIISVEDSGRGIKKENIDKMFTKFQRLDEDRNTTIEGTGLGLAITKQLIELMGGKIIVHTVYGEGSKFTVVLNQRIEVPDEVTEKKVKSTLDLKDIRILMVDDTPLNLKVTTKLLEKYNANHVITCDSGFECLEKIQRGETYDIILLDDMMPRMSGVETFKKLKEIPGFNTPTVALTANAISGMREKYLADGFNDYLAKPIEKDELIRVCNEILGRSATEDINVGEINKSTSNAPIRDDIIVNDFKDQVIPVEDNIEEELGKTLEITKRDIKPIDENNISEVSTIPVIENNSEVITEITSETVTEVSTEVSTVPVIENIINGINIVPPIENAVVETLEDTNTNINTNEVNSKCDRSYLEANGVDVNHALELLGDMEMYNMTINDFMAEVEDKWNRICEYKANSDMENYAIDVHSLKSDCKYLGFMTLADIAYQHELKSKEKDVTFVNNNFLQLEEEYKKVLEIAKNYVKDNPVSE